MSEQDTFEGWAVLELMGHRRLAGYLQEEQIGGVSFLRIDVRDEEDRSLATQFYSPSAVYCITPCTAQIARQFARRGFDGPIHRWELREIAAPVRAFGDEDEDDEDLDA